MRGSSCQIERVLDEASIVESVSDGREAVSLPSSIQHCSKFDTDQKEGNVQKPIYYTNQAFQGVEASYPRMEKIAFALLVASRKLCPYFQAHPIIVMTDQPIRKTMNKIDAVGRLIQWAIDLGQFDIEYRP